MINISKRYVRGNNQTNKGIEVLSIVIIGMKDEGDIKK